MKPAGVLALGLSENTTSSWWKESLSRRNRYLSFRELKIAAMWCYLVRHYQGQAQLSSVTQSCLTFCHPMDCSMPGLPVHHQLPELTQTHVHWVCDTIQPSHPLSSPSLPVFDLSQHQGLFKQVSSSHQVAKVWEFQFEHQFFQWVFRTDLLQDGLVGSSCSPKHPHSSNTTVQKHQFFGAQLCL